MGFFDEIKKLTQPFDDQDDFFDEDDASTRIPVDKPSAQEKKSSFFSDGSDYELPAKPTFSSRRDYRQDPAKVVSLNASAQLKVVLVKPERFEAAADIADHLRDKRAVVMNLEQTNKDIARRLIDFLSGVAYAQDGKIKKIAANTYIITPYNVDLMGDLMGELENTGLRF
ncbi:MAG: cell division protein SepF [Clostridia bacterium]|nr:cell division protein SepF [Clostridia bacterium]